jgi:hypothetical protein
MLAFEFAQPTESEKLNFLLPSDFIVAFDDDSLQSCQFVKKSKLNHDRVHSKALGLYIGKFFRIVAELQPKGPKLQSQKVDHDCRLNEPAWVSNSRSSLQRGDAELCPTGLGGTYFVLHQKEKIAVFKPMDEEPGSSNNPKKSLVAPLLPGGNGAFRELAAYALDKSFIGVPETHIIEVSTPNGLKKGSLQKYVGNDGDCTDLGANKFSVEDVHRIGVFDIRALNMDRNDENLLVQSSSDGNYKLIPIDHTYCFPEKIDPYFNWQFWTQAKQPFSENTLSYVDSIDIRADAELLSKLGIDPVSVRNVVASTLLLQKMARRGYTLFQIASLVSGPSNKLAGIVEQVNRHFQNRIESLNEYIVITEQLIDELLSQM